MQHHFKRLAWVLLSGVLMGCSMVGSLYQTAPKLAMYELDSSIDLSGAQYDQGLLQLEAVYEWHRKTELPLAVVQLRTLASLAPRPLNADQVERTLQWAQASLKRLLAHTTAQQISLAQSLGERNWKALEKKYAKDNAKFRKEWLDAGLKTDINLSQEKRFDTFQTWAERIYGDLSREQLKVLRSASDARVLRMDWVYQERLLRQQALLRLLREAPTLSAVQVQSRIQSYTALLEQASTPERQALNDQGRQQMVALIVQLNRTVTDEQRQYAQKKLLGFADTFEAIAKQP